MARSTIILKCSFSLLCINQPVRVANILLLGHVHEGLHLEQAHVVGCRHFTEMHTGVAFHHVLTAWSDSTRQTGLKCLQNALWNYILYSRATAMYEVIQCGEHR